MIAYGMNEQGHREILDFAVCENESKETWKAFLLRLRNRGLTNVLMITSDAHEGIRDGISKVFPQVPWQRCQFHFSKNIADKAPKKYQAGLRAELQEMFNCQTLPEARQRRDSIIQDYKDVAEAAMLCLDEGFESAMTAMVLPKSMRQYFSGYTGAVKPPVRMTGNRESGHKETGMCAAEPPSRRRCSSGWAAS